MTKLFHVLPNSFTIVFNPVDKPSYHWSLVSPGSNVHTIFLPK